MRTAALLEKQNDYTIFEFSESWDGARRVAVVHETTVDGVQRTVAYAANDTALWLTPPLHLMASIAGFTSAEILLSQHGWEPT